MEGGLAGRPNLFSKSYVNSLFNSNATVYLISDVCSLCSLFCIFPLHVQGESFTIEQLPMSKMRRSFTGDHGIVYTLNYGNDLIAWPEKSFELYRLAKYRD